MTGIYNSAHFGGVSIGNSNGWSRFIAKFTNLTENLSNCAWAKNISYPIVTSCIDKQSGALYLTGEYDDPITADTFSLPADQGYPYDGYIAKYNTNGACEWLQRTGDRGGTFIAVDKLGSINIAGELWQTITFGNDFDSVTLTDEHSNLDFFVAQYDTAGDFKWVKGLYGDSATYGAIGLSGMGVDEENNIIMIGSRYGLVDVGNGMNQTFNKPSTLILKYDSAGNYQWLKEVESKEGGNDFYDIFISSQNDIYLTGMMSDTMNFNGVLATSTIPGRNNMFVAKYDSNGDFRWVQHSNTIDNSQCYSEGVSVNERNGMVWVAGNFSGSEGFGDSVFYTPDSGPVDIFIAKFRDQEILPIGIDDNVESASQLLVYPNPAVSSLNVLYNSIIDEQVEFHVNNLLGEEITKIRAQANKPAEVETQDLSKGLYFIEVIANGKKEVKKVIVQ